MADDAVVDTGTQGTSTTTDSGTAGSEKTTTDSQKTGTTTQRPDPALGTKSGDETERRFKGIQADLQKERKQRQEYERQVTQFQTELAAEKRRVAALAGVDPQNPADAEREAIRKRFGEVFSREELLQYLGLSVEEVDGLKTTRESAKAAEDRMWKSHGQAVVDGIAKEISKELGGDLSAKQRTNLIMNLAQRLQMDAEFLKRYEDDDETLIKEFADEWNENWFKPIQRKTTQTEANRYRPVPGGRDRSIVNQGEKKIDVTDPKQVEDFLVKGYREKGGEFGHR